MSSSNNESFKKCPACDGFVPIKDKRCPFCEAKQLHPLEVRVQKFFRKLFPSAFPTTGILLAVIILYFILMSLDIVLRTDAGFMSLLWSPPTEVIWRWGSHIRGDFVWWRFIMANFVHIGALHLFFNSSALKTIGPMVERYYGATLTLALFVILGTASMATSNVLGAHGIVAGASGGIMGFVGLLASTGRREKTAAGRKISSAMWMTAGFIMLLGVVISFSGTMGIDNIAHGSGFVYGFLVGLFLPFQGITGFTSRAPLRVGALLSVVSIAAVVWAVVSMLATTDLVNSHTACISAIKEKRPASALRECGKAYEATPKDYAAINNYILSLHLVGETDKALALCDKARKELKVEDFAKISPELCSF